MPQSGKACPFCSLDKSRVLVETDKAAAFFDNYPVSNGHVLVIPRRHVESIFRLEPEEWTALWGLVAEVQSTLIARFAPDGINIGVNDGQAAGQTIPHAHIHLIPRYSGDVEDPRGGVRWVIPQKAKYW